MHGTSLRSAGLRLLRGLAGGVAPSALRCNLCGGTEWTDMNSRKGVRCASCKSVERTRLMKLWLDKLGLPRPGMSVLHLAPEAGLAAHISGIVGRGYCPADKDPDRYRHVPNVRQLDLCTGLDDMPRSAFDVIVHSHVIEHVPCNYTAVLVKLNRLLKDDGVHVCSIPFLSGRYDETTAPIGNEEARRRFGQHDHVRRFGTGDIQSSLGMVVRLPETYDATRDFPEEVLLANNIPKSCWRGYTPHSVLVFRKDDFLLH